MQTTEIVLLAIAAVIGFLLLMRVVKALMHVVLIVAVIGAIYYFLLGGKTATEPSNTNIEVLFDNATISELMGKHCTPDKLETVACKCAIIPANDDFTSRFNATEIRAMQHNRAQLLAETTISFKNARSSIESCMSEQKNNTFGFFQKIKDLYHLITQ